MSRQMKSTASEAYRVVAQHPTMGELVYGPYATKGVAKGIATRECGPTYWEPERNIPHKIQRSTQAWVDVE